MDELTLRDILSHVEPPPYVLQQAIDALALPWCWPRAAEFAGAASELRRETGISTPRAGETLLVSVDGARVSLWRLDDASRAVPHARVLELIGGARETAHRAWIAALCDLPVLVNAGPFNAQPEWRAAPIASIGGGTPERALTGESFGLALALASTSRCLDEPMPADVVALAAIGDDGELRPVDAIASKLRVIRGWALGVRRVLVCDAQVEEATRAAGGEFAIEGVSSLSRAIAMVWPDAIALARARWQDRAAAVAAVERLFRLALDSRVELPSWRSVQAAAAVLAWAVADDPDARWRAKFVHDVATRHGGAIDRVIEWPPDHPTLPRPVRLRLLANVLQNETDADRLSTIELALAQVAAPLERHEADLELLGAVGRAFAAAGQIPRALAVLREAIAGWIAIGRAGESSRPVCELVRLLGLLGDSAALDAAIAGEVARVRVDRPSNASRCFLAFAVGRALVTLGRDTAGVAALADGETPWARSPDHVRLARLRWLARGLARLGDREATVLRRSEIERACAGTAVPDPNLHLARIDLALEEGRATGEHIRALLASAEHREFERLLREMPGGGGKVANDEVVARWFSDRYRY